MSSSSAAVRRVGGFTLLEVLLAIAFIALLTTAAAPLYTNLQGSAQLNTSASEFAQTLEHARTRSVARLNDSAHGVYLQSDRYTLYQGENYANRDTEHDRAVLLESALTLSASPSVSDLNFSKGFGVPSATSTFTLTHDVYGTTTIIIDELGSVQ